MAPQTVLSERERLIQQPEEALKHQELEAGELEVDSSSPIAKITASGASATQTLPRVEHSDRRDAEIRCTAPSKRSSQSHISQARTSLRSKHARSQTETASHRFLSPQGDYLQGINSVNTADATKSVKSTHTSPRHDQENPVQAQDLDAFTYDIEAMMRET